MKKLTRHDAYTFFQEGVVALSKIEHNGLKVDVPYLTNTIKELDDQIHQNTKEMRNSPFYKKWMRAFGSDTNMDSIQQLGHVLKKEGFTSRFVTEKGKEQWDEKALSYIQTKEPFIELLLRTKKLKKANGTYLKGILREVDSNGFLHPSYNLAGNFFDEKQGGSALSYRGSSSDPNFQNMPIRNPVMSKYIRRAFIPREGYLGTETDYGQIEVRVSAMYNHDSKLIEYINDPTTDMHKDMACEIFMLKPEQIGKKSTRDASKNIFVFPAFYGSYYVDIARNLWEAMLKREFKIEGTDKLVIDHLREKGIKKLGKCDPGQSPVKGTFEYHIQQVENDFWNVRFKEYTAWKKRTYEQYLKKGYIQMHTGFICKGNYRRNQVLNFAIQGTAFHCLLWSIIQIQKAIEKYKMKTKLTGQIHDCFLADVHKKEMQAFLSICRETMTEKIRKAWPWIIVPLETEVDVFDQSQTWHGKTPWECKNGVWASKS